METVKKKILLVNMLFWVVAALLQPLAGLLPTGSGETPKIFSLLIPLAFIGLAYGSTILLWRAMASQGAGPAAEPAAASHRKGI